MIVRVLVLVCLLCCPVVSWAGVTASDAPENDEPPTSDDAWYTRFENRIDGLDTPLFAPPDLPPALCSPDHTPVTRGLFIAAGQGLEMPQFNLPGPANDVALFQNALALRGADPAKLITLDGQAATHAALAETALKLLGEVGCDDTLILQFSGFALNASVIGLPEGDGGPFGLSRKVKSLGEIGGKSMSTSPADSAIAASPFALLNIPGPNRGAVLSAAALSELITQFRNRGAHVSVVLDTASATEFDIEGRQARIDSSLYPRLSLEARGGCDDDCIDGWQPTLLAPRAGNLTVFYGTRRGSPGVERRLPPGHDEALTYGMLSYQLATALSLSERTTVGALARHIEDQDVEEVRQQSYTFVTTDPDLDLIAEDRPPDTFQAPQILIDSPQLTRAALKLSKPVVEITGRIAARGKPIQVRINDSFAQLDDDTGFLSRFKLKAGVNKISVHAITDENESLRYDFELFYEGDIRAVIGQGKRYALIIANQDYDDGSGISDLKTPLGDAAAVRDLLVNTYGFTTEAVFPDGKTIDLFLENATHRDIALTLGPLARLAGPKDSVLIFYAGHGEYDTATNAAYWLPTDAFLDNPATFFDAKTLNDILQTMKAGNVLVISDSCYSGMLLRAAENAKPVVPAKDRLLQLQRMSESRSRVVLSSGGNTPVLDGGGGGHSVFARALLSALERPENTAFSARELHDRLFSEVSGRSDQEPDFRAIYGAGHDGGDFVFLMGDGG